MKSTQHGQQQLSLFGPGTIRQRPTDPMQIAMQDRPAPHNNTPTSIEAAKAKREDAKTERLRVAAYLKAQGMHGATDEEMQEALGMEGSTQRPRRVELVQMGLAKAQLLIHPDCTATRSMRPTKSGRMAQVWASFEFEQKGT